MSAIITDQIRILNAKNFVAGVSTNTNSYYAFIGLPNPTGIRTDWDSNPPSPVDSFSDSNDYYDDMIAVKKITPADCKQIVQKNSWSSGTTYDYYRQDYSITNAPKNSGGTTLYTANYFVVNSDYRVYICLQNGTTPETPDGKPSLDEPTFTDLEPRIAGTSGDGYIWKYLYSIKPADLIKFDSTDFMPVPAEWDTNTTDSAIRNNAVDGGIKIVVVKNRGTGIGTANQTYTRVPIKGDGFDAECTVVVNNDQQIESVTVSNEGYGYTYGNVDLAAGSVPTPTTEPTLDVIIPPPGGHGKDIYRELGASSALLYARIENDAENPDFITGNQFARIGIIENPRSFGSTQLLTLDKAAATYAIRLSGTGYSSVTFPADGFITQTVGTGVTAVGRTVSYDQTTGVLKYWQDRTIAGFNTVGTAQTVAAATYGYDTTRFTADPTAGGTRIIVGGSSNLSISTTFSGLSTSINNRTYYLGQSFTKGLANPEIKKYSGNMIYVDHRPSITRSSNQKEDIKIILQF
tara:strand:+ start:15097 stop:16653 length:1557 start_codon:yes stop_codon:yes gene_type:complete